MTSDVVQPPQSIPTYRIEGPYGIWRLDFHGLTIETIAPHRRLARKLGLMLGSYPLAPAQVPADIRVRATPRRSGAYWDISFTGMRYDAGDIAGTDAAAKRIEWVIVTEAIMRLSRFLHVHAAVVATPASSLLLVGSSGSGKSTTAVALAQTGLALYTDDVALLERDTLRPVFVPRPIKLDMRSRRLLRAYGVRVPPEARLGECVARTALPGWPPHGEPGPPLRAALFFAGERATRPSLRRLTVAEAALRLAAASSTDGLGSARLSADALAAVTGLHSYELTAGELDATVRVLLDLVS